MIEWSIHQEDITVLNGYPPNNRVYETKMERGKRQAHNYKWRFDHSFLSDE